MKPTPWDRFKVYERDLTVPLPKKKWKLVRLSDGVVLAHHSRRSVLTKCSLFGPDTEIRQ